MIVKNKGFVWIFQNKWNGGKKMKWNGAEQSEMKYNFHIIVWIFYGGA
jgi:hypothetical protein